MDEYADEEWIDDDTDDESDDILQCPACGCDVHEDTQQCPHCGDWITPVYPGERTRKVVWLAVAVLIVVGLLLLTIL